MGLFDLFKKKGVDDQTFNSPQFQQEMLAFGLWKYGDNNGNLDKVRAELLALKDVNLDDTQADELIKRLREMFESPDGKFRVGQIWQYKTRNSETPSRATIFKIDRMANETIIHVSLDGLHIERGNSDALVKTIGHLPISVTAFENSVTALDHQTDEVPTINEGYEQWRSAYNDAKAGVFETEIKEIVEFIEKSMNP